MPNKKQRELKRIQTSTGYGFGRMGLPKTHRLGKNAYTDLFRQRERERIAMFVYDPLSELKAPSDQIFRGNDGLLHRR